MGIFFFYHISCIGKWIEAKIKLILGYTCKNFKLVFLWEQKLTCLPCFYTHEVFPDDCLCADLSDKNPSS